MSIREGGLSVKVRILSYSLVLLRMMALLLLLGVWGLMTLYVQVDSKLLRYSPVR